MDRINNILNDVNTNLSKQYANINTDTTIEDPILSFDEMRELLEIQAVQDKISKIKNNPKLKNDNILAIEHLEIESTEKELTEYKQDFYDMSVGSLAAIAAHAQKIIENLSNPKIKENLTESWLQGKIAITEDYMRTIHDFVMYVNQSDDNTEAASRPGLWENIRKKKERMGKKI